MRIFKSCIFIFLILKASIGFGMITSIISDGCCDSNQAIEIVEHQNSDNEDKGCCGNEACNCVCCGHLFVGSSIKVIQPIKPLKADSNPIFFYDGYKILMASSIWQPPRSI